MTLKKFEVGERVKVARGQMAGNEGTVLGQHEIKGTVEIAFDNGVSAFESNGNVVRAKGKDGKPVPKVDVTELLTEDAPEGEVGDLKAAPVELPDCECGCGDQVANKKRTFLPGHDQRLKGYYIRRVQGKSLTTDRLPASVSASDAELELTRRGWRSAAEIVELKSKAAPKVKAEAEATA